MEAMPEHTIAIGGLKDGHHSFTFELGPAFFEACRREEFLGGAAHVGVELEKNNTLVVVRLHVDGHVDMLCDHCNAPMHQGVSGDQRQIFKLTGEGESDDAELVNLDPGTMEINLSHYIYECISLNLPIRHVHAQGECDPAVTAALDRMQTNHEPDPRWSALDNLKKRSA